MLEVTRLRRPEGPHLHFAQSDVARACLRDLRTARAAAFVGSLQGVTSRDRLFDVLQASLTLPTYFGRNWDALDECLRELPDRSSDQCCTLVLYHALSFWRESTVLAAEFSDIWLATAAECARGSLGLHLIYAW